MDVKKSARKNSKAEQMQFTRLICWSLEKGFSTQLNNKKRKL